MLLPWSIEDYSKSLTPSQNISTERNEAELLRDFPPLFCNEPGELLPLQDQPCIVVDSQGIIVLWYLPDAITRARNVLVFSNFAEFLLTFHQKTGQYGPAYE